MKRSKRKKAIDRLKTLQEVRAWLLTCKKSDSRTSALRYLKIFIDGLTKDQQNVLILTLNKQDFLDWEFFKQNQKEFIKFKKQK